MYHIFSVRAEHTQAAAALRSRLLAPSISTPAAAAAQETPGRGMLSANMTTSNTRYLSAAKQQLLFEMFTQPAV